MKDIFSIQQRQWYENDAVNRLSPVSCEPLARKVLTEQFQRIPCKKKNSFLLFLAIAATRTKMRH